MNDNCEYHCSQIPTIISDSESYPIGLIWFVQYFKSAKKWILSWHH